MTLDEFNKEINLYIKNNNTSWIALHDAHSIKLIDKIFNSGLCVSHNPFGKRGKNIPVEDNFMTTMYYLTSKSVSLQTLPVAPIIIKIPQEILALYSNNGNEELTYQKFCLYGKQEINTATNYDGNTEYSRGDITPLETAENANVRMLPSYFIAGYYNISTGKFIQNSKHFYNLSKEDQEKVIKLFQSLISTNNITI